MLQDGMNNIAILHIYHDMVDKLGIEKFLNKFITKYSQNSANFALCRK